jgi:hypothetical protein
MGFLEILGEAGEGLLRTVAPTVATALGGPLAGTAVRFLADKLLGDPDAPLEDVARALQTATPEQLIQIKQIDTAFALEMKKADIALEQSHMADTQNARAVHGGDGKVFWLGIIILVTFAGTMGAAMWGSWKLLTNGMTVVDVGVVAALFGFLGTVVGYIAAQAQQVVNYYFGSSSGSKTKTDALAASVAGIGSRQ